MLCSAIFFEEILSGRTTMSKMKLIHSTLFFVITVIFPWNVEGSEIDNLCETIAKIDLRDTYNVLDERYHYNRYRSLFENQSFNSYKDLQNFAGSAGLSIPMLDGIFKFTAAAKNDAGVFRQEYAKFINSQASEYFDRYK